MKNLKILLVLLLIISIFALSLHDGFHSHPFYSYFSPYRLNIKDQNPCFVCQIEGLIGRIIEKIVLVFVCLVFILFRNFLKEDLASLLQEGYRFLSPISLKVKMTN